jgi:hypothetical protein
MEKKNVNFEIKPKNNETNKINKKEVQDMPVKITK